MFPQQLQVLQVLQVRPKKLLWGTRTPRSRSSLADCKRSRDSPTALAEQDSPRHVNFGAIDDIDDGIDSMIY